MDGYVKKFLIVFAGLMIITFGLTFAMIAMINPDDPGSIGVGVLFFLGTFLPLLFISIAYLSKSGPSKREKRLMQMGTHAPAEVLKVEDTGVTINEIYPMVKLTLRVRPKSSEVFDVKIDSLVSRVSLPRPGDMLEVIFDPQKPSNIMIVREDQDKA